MREISRKLGVSRNTVRGFIRRQGAVPQTTRKDKLHVDVELLRRLYQECGGWAQRVHERLNEEADIQISYPTLTRLLRELGISRSSPTRCDRVPDEPGAEMQHDTTTYQVKLSDQPTRVIASLLYLRYSKRRYLKFYRVFNRFAMKCFLHEALLFWGCSARRCIIDNTNLARLRGTGRRAVIVPEMVSFAQRYSFQFVCHEIGHPNRKAGEERSFWTVETNFLPGRVFENLEDLNQQAREWATVRMHHRPQSKTGLIPALAFEHEQPQLIPLEYADRVRIFRRRTCVAEYALPPEGTRNARYSPPGRPLPRYQPRRRPRDSSQEEQRLRAMGPQVSAYLDYALQRDGFQRHRFLRAIWMLSCQVTPAVFARTLERALRYRIVELPTLHRIAWLCLSLGEERPLDVEVDDSFRDRPTWQEGCLTDEPDLSRYDQPPFEQPADDDDDPEELADVPY